MNACADGRYKHYVKGMGWVRCKCGSYQVAAVGWPGPGRVDGAGTVLVALVGA